MEKPPRNNLRTKKVSTYLSQRELDEVRKKVANSTCRGLSEYSWKLLMGAPVTVYYRNKSFDEFVAEGVRIRREIKQLLEKDGLSKESEERLLLLIGQISHNLNNLTDHVRKNKNKQKHQSNTSV
ncbi:MAG TPA: hypothetical protein VGN00_12810 [Puia sp.]|jgi:hypothetical protein